MKTFLRLAMSLGLLAPLAAPAHAGKPGVKRMINTLGTGALPYRDFDAKSDRLRQHVSGYLQVVGGQRNGKNAASVVLSGRRRGRPAKAATTGVSFYDQRAYVPAFGAKKVFTWPNKHLAIPVLGKSPRKPSEIKVTGNLSAFGMTAPVKVGDRWLRFAIIHTDGMVGDQQLNNKARNKITVPDGKGTREIEILMGPRDL